MVRAMINRWAGNGWSASLWIIACCLLAGCSKPAESSAAPAARGRPPVSVEIHPVEERALREVARLVGTLIPNEEAEVRPEVSGRVMEVLFEEGQAVAAGQPLLRLDDAEILAQIAAADAAASLARTNLARARSLVEAGTQTRSDLDRAEAEFERTTAERALLQVRLDRTLVRAPFAGRTARRDLSPGDFVTQADVVTTVTDFSLMKVEFEAPERVRAGISLGAPVAVSVARSRAPITGTVFFVSPVIDRETRTSLVRARLDGAQLEMASGQFVQVEVVLARRDAATIVPESAILSRAAGSVVVIARETGGETVAEFMPVRLGLREPGLVEVTPVRGELPVGTQVVAAGVGAIVLIPGDKLVTRPLRAELRPPAAASPSTLQES